MAIVPRRVYRGVLLPGLLLTSLGLFATLSACSTSERESDPSERPQGPLDSAAPEVALTTAFHDMAEILEEHPPAEATALMRTYLNTHRSILAQSATALERKRLDLEGESLEAFVNEASPPLQAAVERFARAQMAFRQGASPPQKIELQEVLTSMSSAQP